MIITWFDKNYCPLCDKKLVKKHEGRVCQNFGCSLYFKLGKGWVYLDGAKKNSLQFIQDNYKFNIERFENKKQWLKLKAEVLNERDRKCEICSSKIELHVHHIIYRSDEPLLTFDKENLMVLCSSCHKNIHSEDKKAYR